MKERIKNSGRSAARPKLKSGFKRVLEQIFVNVLYKWFFRLIGLLPVKRKLIIFESFFGRQYSCNPRAIYEYMEDHHPDYQLIWSVNRRHTELFEQKNIPYARRFSLNWLLLVPRASFWVTNVRLPLWMVKPKHTVYLQTWHGTPLKKLGLDIETVRMADTKTETYRKGFLLESARWDCLLAPNRYSSEIFRRAFGFEGKLLESGYPRNDILYQPDKQSVEALKEKCGLPKDKKVLLYAPTWRDDQFYTKGRYKFTLALDLERMSKQLQDNCILLIRTHYLIADQLDLSSYQGFAWDFSHYEDIRDLYLMADLLITDYSSVFFDYANLRRPMIFFAYDIEDYRDHLRGFYFDFEKEAPGPIVRTTDEVIHEVHRAEQEDFTATKQFQTFYDRYCSLEDGGASERVARQVFHVT